MFLSCKTFNTVVQIVDDLVIVKPGVAYWNYAKQTRKNRLGKCPLKSTAELTREGRGPIDYKIDLNTGLRVVKWLGGNEVRLVSTYDFIEPVTEVQRWDETKKEHVVVPYPKIV